MREECWLTEAGCRCAFEDEDGRDVVYDYENEDDCFVHFPLRLLPHLHKRHRVGGGRGGGGGGSAQAVRGERRGEGGPEGGPKSGAQGRPPRPQAAGGQRGATGLPEGAPLLLTHSYSDRRCFGKAWEALEAAHPGGLRAGCEALTRGCRCVEDGRRRRYKKRGQIANCFTGPVAPTPAA